MTKSTAERWAKELLGSNARVKPGPSGEGFVVYTEHGRTRTYYGAGETYEAAIRDCMVFEDELFDEAQGKFSVSNGMESSPKISSPPESDGT